ncbi:PepSY domain-containing protein [Porphyromonas macacae]|uniref:PepSY domain-containing protein n=2 Tax=Porphyromonas macacae TaxID=28115 RepID=UPI0035A054F0
MLELVKMVPGNYARISKCLVRVLFTLLWVYGLSSCGIFGSGTYKKVSCDFDYSIREEDKILNTSLYQSYTEKESDTLLIRVVVWKEKQSTINSNIRPEKYIVYISNKKTKIESTLSYDSQGRICQADFQYSKAFVGPRYYFDEHGNITDSIDTDAGYTICWAQAMAIGKAHAGHKMHKTEPNLILDKGNEGTYEWHFLYDDKKKRTKELVIDAKTGKVIKEYKVRVIV